MLSKFTGGKSEKNEKAESNNPTILPPEMLCLVFDNLLHTEDYPSIATFSRICKFFNEISNRQIFTIKNTNLRLFNNLTNPHFQSCVSAIDTKDINRLAAILNDSVLNISARPNNDMVEMSLLHYAINRFYSDKSNKVEYFAIVSLLIDRNANPSLTTKYEYELSNKQKKLGKEFAFLNKILGAQTVPYSTLLNSLQLNLTPLQYAQILGRKFKDRTIEKLLSANPEPPQHFKCNIM